MRDFIEAIGLNPAIETQTGLTDGAGARRAGFISSRRV